MTQAKHAQGSKHPEQIQSLQNSRPQPQIGGVGPELPGGFGSRTHYQVPRGNDEFLIAPSVTQTAARIEDNRSQFNLSNKTIWGRSLGDWRVAGRTQCLNRAVCYTSQLDHGPCQTVDVTVPLIGTGHQPELFHPGVWVKNVLASQLAQQIGGHSLNVVIDSDAVKSRSVRIPQNSDGALQFGSISVDEWPLGMPWQELKVRNPEQFRSFANRAAKRLPTLSTDSVLPEYWSSVLKQWDERDDLTAALIAGRRAMEMACGIQNLEVPISQVCHTEVFGLFAANMLLDADNFRHVYNQSLAHYRAVYGLKSDTHPMPDLTSEDGWVETPFWVWTAQQWQRHGLFVRTRDGRLELTDSMGFTHSWDRQQIDSPETLARELTGLMRRGLRLRPRALVTTLFLRLFVCDWFLHGIGGAKYDEITDRLIERYFSIKPPTFQVATGTVHLPIIDKPIQAQQSLQRLGEQLRYAEENPETLADDPSTQPWCDLIARKNALIAERQAQPKRGLSRRQRRDRRHANKARHHQFAEIRQKMATLAEPELMKMRRQLAMLEDQAEQQSVAEYREYPVCFYPRRSLQTLTERLGQLNSLR